MRTEQEIKKQVEALKKVRESMPEFSVFGDANWKSIDAQIAILEGTKTYANYSEAEDRIESAAYDAKEWLYNNGDPLTDEEE